jgi:hypothetical protein
MATGPKNVDEKSDKAEQEVLVTVTDPASLPASRSRTKEFTNNIVELKNLFV